MCVNESLHDQSMHLFVQYLKFRSADSALIEISALHVKQWLLAEHCSLEWFFQFSGC